MAGMVWNPFLISSWLFNILLFFVSSTHTHTRTRLFLCSCFYIIPLFKRLMYVCIYMLTFQIMLSLLIMHMLYFCSKYTCSMPRCPNCMASFKPLCYTRHFCGCYLMLLSRASLATVHLHGALCAFLHLAFFTLNKHL